MIPASRTGKVVIFIFLYESFLAEYQRWMLFKNDYYYFFSFTVWLLLLADGAVDSDPGVMWSNHWTCTVESPSQWVSSSRRSCSGTWESQRCETHFKVHAYQKSLSKQQWTWALVFMWLWVRNHGGNLLGLEKRIVHISVSLRTNQWLSGSSASVHVHSHRLRARLDEGSVKNQEVIQFRSFIQKESFFWTKNVDKQV